MLFWGNLRRTSWLICLLAIPLAQTGAQSSSSAIILLLSPSPTMNGMGEIGTALPGSDLYGVYFNPANFPAINGLQISYVLPSATPWFPRFFSDFFLRKQAIQIGYDGWPKLGALSAGYYRVFLDFPEIPVLSVLGVEIDTIQPFMVTDAITLGVRRRLDLRSLVANLSMGGSAKLVRQQLGIFVPGTVDEISSSDIFYDIGVLASIKGRLPLAESIALDISPSFGYSLLNMGDAIVFSGFDSRGPPPTTARIGWSAKVGIIREDTGRPLISVTYGQEASDELILRSEQDSQEWKTDYPLGDIKPLRHLFGDDPMAPVNLHRGWEVALVGTFYIRSGKFRSPGGNLTFQTEGYGFDMSVLTEMWAQGLPDSPMARLLGKHLRFRYDFSRRVGSTTDGMVFRGLTITLSNLDKLRRSS